MTNFCQLWLTCADKQEADKIVNTLLVKHLVVCARQIPLTADYLWQGKIDHNDEVLLIMDSRDDLFSEVERTVAKLHSYDTFVLEMTPIERLSVKAEEWIKGELR